MRDTDMVLLDVAAISQLLERLMSDGYLTIGPTIDDEVIRLRPVTNIDDFPVGMTDVHEGGQYRLEPRSDDALFGYNVGPDSGRSWLSPAESPVFAFDRETGMFEQALDEPEPVALVGLRPCELAAIGIQDRLYMGGAKSNPYQRRREQLFTVAVNCVEAGATCFCDSMGTGPSVGVGYDIVLTELVEGDHRFAAQAGSERGLAVLDSMPSRAATATDRQAVTDGIDHARATMGRTMNTDDIRDLLVSQPDHPAWEEIAKACLACTNCTMVCPTCFCTTMTDASSFDGTTATRAQVWDSCFSLDFSYMGGQPVRSSVSSRYRQWATHKLGTWHDQFGVSGCVGCGRCITWCPVGIDITATIEKLRAPEEVFA